MTKKTIKLLLERCLETYEKAYKRGSCKYRRCNIELTEIGIPGESSIPMKHARILRGPYQMSFDITNKCNFRCLHCYNRSGENPVIEKELTDAEVIEFAKDLSKIKLFN
ncbi:MAG: hypothetical protein NTV78_00685, partial [Caldiserica bacterium]|nr:hypothetical protein [Caldisericota bacterium]